jgi:transcriptional regulator
VGFIDVDIKGIVMEPEKSDLLQGTLDMLILKVLASGPIHGYAISQRIQKISRDALQVQQGSLYPALHRMENHGWLRAEWRASETGRDAKFYALTKAGRKQLELETSHWARLSDAIALILQTAE